MVTGRRAALAALASLGLACIAGQARAQAGRRLRVVALGDSLTAGYMLPAASAFPAVLEAALRAGGLDVEIVNAGVSGDTASQGLERLAWSVPAGTDAVILELGANDALRGVDPAITRQALDDIIARLKARGIAVMLAGMFAPRNMGSDYVRAFDAIYPELAARHGLVLYPFFMDGVIGQQGLVMRDGLHPTAQGVQVLVERITPTVRRFLEGLPKPG